ncbi:MAG: hypothetical protein CJD30_11185 [Sulfuricurvum sp. PD_MW2]|jgi:hypothetical protein|uniref:hypothetical protein n=1 Tax=Sulfuricurvum sp. PD_MW2 TaxID=2027917 RepID=UPI000C061FE2|nr:hypothetical protein [Sulfuricurvum sp. PD_MW2]PHM16514.1 MAG: hypothetical protein CJD30_11185 [Sulfuricurvum sp. PD_MW2]
MNPTSDNTLEPEWTKSINDAIEEALIELEDDDSLQEIPPSFDLDNDPFLTLLDDLLEEIASHEETH